MPAPFSTVVDLNILVKRLARLKNQLQSNNMTVAKALSTSILADLTSVDTLIQAATDNVDLPDDPTLDPRENP